jgi:hypothetical protein
MAFPSDVAIFWRLRRVSPSPAAWGLRRDLASGTVQRLCMSITGSSSGRSLRDVAIVMSLHELAPVGGWAPDR